MDETTQRQLDRLLAAATDPELPAGAMQRLLARIEGENRIVALPLRRRAPHPVLGWSAALPLAASLALGIYLGAMGSLDRFLPESVTGELAAGEEGETDLSGVSEAEAYAEEDVS